MATHYHRVTDDTRLIHTQPRQNQANPPEPDRNLVGVHTTYSMSANTPSSRAA